MLVRSLRGVPRLCSTTNLAVVATRHRRFANKRFYLHIAIDKELCTSENENIAVVTHSKHPNAVDYAVNSFPSFKGPTSKINTNYDRSDFKSNWIRFANTSEHELFRFYHQLIKDTVCSEHFNDACEHPWKLGIFEQWWHSFYWAQILDHQDNEEVILYPLINYRLHSNREVHSSLQDIQKEHDDIVDIGKRINSLLCHFANSSEGIYSGQSISSMDDEQLLNQTKDIICADFVVELQTELLAFMDAVEHHFEVEERLLPTLVELSFDSRKQYYYQVVLPTLTGMGWNGCARSLPGQIYVAHSWMGDSDVARLFMKGVPTRYKFLNDKLWMPHWRKHALSNMLSIVNGLPPPATQYALSPLYTPPQHTVAGISVDADWQ